MRRFDKNKNLKKANMLSEQRYLESKEGVNEMFGFGSSIDKIANKYASAINNIKLENKELDWDYANEAIAKLKEFNSIVDTMLADNKLMKYLVKNDTVSQLEAVKRNIGVDKYGRNRPDGLYLGDTQGLNTLKIDDWIRKGDYDSNNIITRQLSGWINANADKALKLISQDNNGLVRELEKEVGDGWDSKTVKQGNLELEVIAKKIYSLFKKEGAKTYLSSTHGAVGDKEGSQVAILVRGNSIEFSFGNIPNPQDMVNKYGPLILKTFPELSLDSKDNDYIKLVPK